MASLNTVRIKRGNSTPTRDILEEGELGYSKINRKLYIGTEEDVQCLTPTIPLLFDVVANGAPPITNVINITNRGIQLTRDDNYLIYPISDARLIYFGTSTVEEGLNARLLKTGGDMTGLLKLKGVKLTPGTDYGTSLPTNLTSADEGRLFFLEA